jgi:hypothetical protein
MRTYRCPHCQGGLNPEHAIVVLARPQIGPEAAPHTGSEAGAMLLGLHPEPGNYESYLPPGVEPPPAGTCFEIRCPLCRADLTATDAENLCALELQEDEQKRRVLFSAVAGERATFLIDGPQVVARFGEHADQHLPRLAYMKYVLT